MTCAILGWQRAIEGLDRIARDRLALWKFNRGGMAMVLVVDCSTSFREEGKIPELANWRPDKAVTTRKAQSGEGPF